ncbi:MAG: glycosyltransferase family 2 protein [Defluviitaleaceae bacterium]|nr:glycosyltransferase family 2 protein [Defluviitaleaceae bacterium]
MKITVMIDLMDNETDINNLRHLSDLRNANDVNFVLITDKKRYEIPIISDKTLNITVQKEKSNIPGIVFPMTGNEILNKNAVDYIKDFYQYNETTKEIPNDVRVLFVSEVQPPPQQDLSTQEEPPAFLISCILPICEGSEHLREAIDSVINQTIGFEENVQLIIIDDVQNDKIKYIYSEYQDKFPNNLLIINQYQQSLCVARNAGLDAAKGKYISFLDEDGIYYNDYFDVCYTHLNDPRYSSIVITAIEPLQNDEYVSPLLNLYFKSTTTFSSKSNSHNILSTVCNVIYDRAISENIYFDTRFGIFNELEFLHRLYLEYEKYTVISTSKYFKRNCLISRDLHFIDYDELDFIRHLFDVSINKTGKITRYTKYNAFALFVYYQNIIHKNKKFDIEVLRSLLNEIDGIIIRNVLKSNKPNDMLMRQFMLTLINQPQQIKNQIIILNYDTADECITLKGYFIIPYNHDYDILITSGNENNNIQIIHHEYEKYLGFIISEKRFFTVLCCNCDSLLFYAIDPSGMTQNIPCLPYYAEENTDWFKLCGEKLFSGTKNSNIININTIEKKHLKLMLSDIIKKTYFAAEYDEEIKVIYDYLRIIELFPEGYNAPDVLDGVEYGSGEHKLYCLLNKKEFPFDAVEHKEFNAIYHGITVDTP